MRNMIHRRPESLRALLVSTFTSEQSVKKRLTFGLPVFILFILFLQVFAAYKPLIPTVSPFQWDPLFADLDHLVHFGNEPWTITHSVFTTPLSTYAINVVYNSWFFVCVAVLAWQAFSTSKPNLKLQYLLSFVAVWIVLGTLAATAMSSAGPCFYNAIVGSNRYLPLMEALEYANRDYPIWALDTQALLLSSYLEGTNQLVTGISAMPSMHVALATLMALFAERRNKVFALVMFAYFVAIYIGSVHLAWHYAIDGIVSSVATVIIWRLAGTLVNSTKTARAYATTH